MSQPRLIAASQDRYSVLLDEKTDSLTIETANSDSRIVIDLANGKIEISSPGDIQFNAGGKLRLKGDQGVEIDGGGDVSLISSEEMIIRGKMVRIN